MRKEKGQELHICLIDIQKAFDSIGREMIFDLLRQSRFDPHVLGLLKAMYKTETSSLILNGRIAKPFKIHQGVRQRASSSPLLFNLIPELLIRKLQ